MCLGCWCHCQRLLWIALWKIQDGEMFSFKLLCLFCFCFCFLFFFGGGGGDGEGVDFVLAVHNLQCTCNFLFDDVF